MSCTTLIWTAFCFSYLNFCLSLMCQIAYVKILGVGYFKLSGPDCTFWTIFYCGYPSKCKFRACGGCICYKKEVGGQISKNRSHGPQNHACSTISKCDDGTSGLQFLNSKLRICMNFGPFVHFSIAHVWDKIVYGCFSLKMLLVNVLFVIL